MKIQVEAIKQMQEEQSSFLQSAFLNHILLLVPSLNISDGGKENEKK